MSAMSVPERISVDSFPMALWLYAKGHRPIAAGLNPATGRAKFIFSGEAQAALASYNEAKAALNLLSGSR